MSDGTGFRVQRFSQLELDEAWLSRACRTIWGQMDERHHGVSIVDAPGGGSLVLKAGRSRRFRRSRSHAAARMALRLGRAGVRTPEAHAVCSQDPGGLRLLVMEHVGALDMENLLLSEDAGDWVSAMVRSIAAMHAADVRHRDLKASNVLLVRGEAGPEAWLIDLDGARHLPFGVGLSRRARDLARLELSLDIMGADGAELLQRYVPLAGWSPAQSARARRVIDAYKIHKRARNARTGRELK